MKKIEPYRNSTEANLDLDNGGRFFNLFTNANDGEISISELGKIAGVFGEKQKMILFLDLAISKLNASDKKVILSALSDGLKMAYEKYKSHYLTVVQATEIGQIASNTIVTGIPKMIDSKSEFVGFVMVPIMAGKVMTFAMIPIMDEYDVYEIRDEQTDINFLIAHAKGGLKLPAKKIMVAGILKELKANENEEVGSKKYLESFYFSDVA
tara:strand:- start:21683 stop:22312 length:630 start_codon:yes stop_codon:yes gene_type:complete